MKNKKQNNKGLFVFMGFFLAVIVVALLVKIFYIPTKTYHSKFLKITIDYPANYELEERFGAIILKNRNGEVILDRVGTNYETIDQYLDYLGRVNKVQIVDRQHISIHNLDAVKATIKHPTNNNYDNKSYYFYINNAIYDIATKENTLHSDLDRVAKSFRYEP